MRCQGVSFGFKLNVQWKIFMHKHLQNLERLSQKMELRYGIDDEVVRQLKGEFKFFEAKVANSHAGAAQLTRKEDKNISGDSPR